MVIFKMITVQEVLQYGIKYLKDANILSYNIDAKVLLMYVLKMDKIQLLTSKDIITEEDYNTFSSLLNRRKNNEPVAYIIGSCEFMSLPFYVDSSVLIPRGDTEILVERAIEEIKENHYKNLLDIGCGSGCIPISICYYTNIQGISVDIDKNALKIAEKNANNNKVNHLIDFVESNLFSNIKSDLKFDIITSNPPYITSTEMTELMRDVVDFEPHLALFGGEDGLDFYKKIVPIAYEKLNQKGMLIFEIGLHQSLEVSSLMKKQGFNNIEILKDYNGLDRVVLGKK